MTSKFALFIKIGMGIKSGERKCKCFIVEGVESRNGIDSGKKQKNFIKYRYKMFAMKNKALPNLNILSNMNLDRISYSVHH